MADPEQITNEDTEWGSPYIFITKQTKQEKRTSPNDDDDDEWGEPYE